MTAADYAISNVDAEGNIVPFYTNIAVDRVFTLADVVAYYDIPGIGSTGNLEIHIFQTFAEDSKTDTVEWIAMDDGCWSVFVPYYPMLTTDVYAAYKVGTDAAKFVQEQPAEGLYYATTGRVRDAEGNRITVEGFKVLPENWADSMYWTFDALSNLCEFGNLSAEQIAEVEAALAELQQQAYAAFEEMKANPDAAADISMKTAEAVHAAVVELVNAIK